MTEYWRRCSTCKLQLDFEQTYWVCNVSTCNRKRTGLIFCSVSCWDAHVPMMNHRDAWAEERTAPGKEKWQRGLTSESDSQRKIIKHSPTMQIVAQTTKPVQKSAIADVEVLVVASKVKALIKKTSDMNTSASAMQALTHIVRTACKDAAGNARADGRKTVLDRDFKKD